MEHNSYKHIQIKDICSNNAYELFIRFNHSQFLSVYNYKLLNLIFMHAIFLVFINFDTKS